MGSEGRVVASYRSSALDVRRLSLFLAVVDCGGFSKAAAAVHLSQPALSQAVAELESELGGPLFNRLPRSVTLTDAGAALVGPARSVLRAVDEARQVTGEVTGLARGRLELSVLRTLSADPLPGLLGRFVRQYPNIAVRLASPDDPGQLVDQVRSGDAELGISAAGRVPPGLVEVRLGVQQLQVIFPPGTVAPPAPLGPAGLAGVGLIVTPRGTSGRELVESWMAAAGTEVTVAVETSQREATVPLVLAGAGAALVPAGAARLAAAAGAVAAGVVPVLARELVVLHRVGPLTPPAAAFLSLLHPGPDND